MSLREYFALSPSTGRSLYSRPESPFTSLQREMNQLFGEFTAAIPGGLSTKFNDGAFPFSPKVDIADLGERFEVTAELPGIEEKDLDLQVTKDALILRGEKREESSRKESRGLTYVERSYGSFERVLPLPDNVDGDKIDASFRNGVLTVKLPKSTPERQGLRKISVRTS